MTLSIPNYTHSSQKWAFSFQFSMSNYEKCLSGIPHTEEESWEFPHCTENEHGLTHLNMYNPVPSVRVLPDFSAVDWGFLLRVPNILLFPNSQSTVFWWLLLFRKNISVGSSHFISYHLLLHSEKPNSLLPVSTTSMWQILLTLSWFCAIHILAL